MAVNPNGAWLLNVASVRGHNVSSNSRSPKNTVKNQHAGQDQYLYFIIESKLNQSVSENHSAIDSAP